MKKFLFIFLFTAAVATVISGCRKDDPGGTVHVSNINSLHNSFVINGGIFNNELVEFSNPVTDYARYYLDRGNTTCLMIGCTSVLGTINFYLDFPGNGLVSSNLNVPDSEYFFNIEGPLLSLFPSMGGADNFYLTITQYGVAGDSIKGTFSGNVIYTAPQDSGFAYISNGSFSFPRVPDF